MADTIAAELRKVAAELRTQRMHLLAFRTECAAARVARMERDLDDIVQRSIRDARAMFAAGNVVPLKPRPPALAYAAGDDAGNPL